MKTYTGIGSRKTPEDILKVIREIGESLGKAGWSLRSGGADGADVAFEDGAAKAGGKGTIYLPWDGFNGITQGLSEDGQIAYKVINHPETEIIVNKIHPAPDRLTTGTMKLHRRNIHQVAGDKLDEPSAFVVYWADGEDTGVPKGGTRTAVAYAQSIGVPTYNLRNPYVLERIVKWAKNPTGVP